MESSFKKNVIKLMSGSLIVQMINFGVQPIITRLYSPSDYGVLSVVTSTIGVLGIIGFCSYERAIPIIKEDSDALALAKSLLIYIVCLTTFMFTTVIALSTFINFNASFILYITCSLLFGIILFDTVLTNLNYRMGSYGSVAKRKVIVAIVSAILQISFGWFKFGANGLLISLLICTFIGVYLIGTGYFRLIKQSKMANKEIFYNYKRLALIETPQNLINTFSIQFPVYFLTHYYSLSVTGQYGLAIKLISVPAAIITSSFSDVFIQKFAKLYNNGGDYHVFTINIWKKLLFFGSIPTIILLIGAPKIFVIVFGANWLMAGQIAQIMCVSTFIAIFSGATLFAFMIMNKGKIMFIYSILLFITRAIGMYILIHDLWNGLYFYVFSEVIIRLVWLYLLHKTMLKEKFLFNKGV